ncbi:MAG: hypothetical protein HQK84_06645 [Nitrospinae bacterium]|nr:hypothetical protein [Nitrospinota bacterium]
MNISSDFGFGFTLSNRKEQPLRQEDVAKHGGNEKVKEQQGEAKPQNNSEAIKNAVNGQLTEAEKKVVDELKKIDQEVRAHEAAHLGAAGGYAVGAANFQYQQGPDNKQYAVAGEVQLDTSPIPNNPEATQQKMQQIKRAALAASNPSAQDLRVAAQASQMEMEASREASEKRKAEQEGEGSGSDSPKFSIQHYINQQEKQQETKSTFTAAA